MVSASALAPSDVCSVFEPSSRATATRGAGLRRAMAGSAEAGRQDVRHVLWAFGGDDMAIRVRDGPGGMLLWELRHFHVRCAEMKLHKWLRSTRVDSNGANLGGEATVQRTAGVVAPGVECVLLLSRKSAANRAGGEGEAGMGGQRPRALLQRRLACRHVLEPPVQPSSIEGQ